MNSNRETVVVTGAGRGLGLAIAAALRQAGFQLILTGRESVRQWSNSALKVIEGDLRDYNTINRITHAAEDYEAKILINNAGVYLNKSLRDHTREEIQDMIQVNLVAPILLTQALWSTLSGGGLVININSLAGKTGGCREAVYSASKAGLRGFSESLQFEGTKDNVRVVDLFVGSMKTDMTVDKPERDKFIFPFEVAKIVEDLCKDFVSLRVPELTIARRNY